MGSVVAVVLVTVGLGAVVVWCLGGSGWGVQGRATLGALACMGLAGLTELVLGATSRNVRPDTGRDKDGGDDAHVK